MVPSICKHPLPLKKKEHSDTTILGILGNLGIYKLNQR